MVRDAGATTDIGQSRAISFCGDKIRRFWSGIVSPANLAIAQACIWGRGRGRCNVIPGSAAVALAGIEKEIQLQEEPEWKPSRLVTNEPRNLHFSARVKNILK
jgi:hypothetical protein